MSTLRSRHLIILPLLALAAGCEQPAGDAVKAEPPVVNSRSNAVLARPDASLAAGWCDLLYPKGGGPQLALPRFEQPDLKAPPVKPGADRWLWLNLWATWCKPCVHEMPLIPPWQQQSEKLGAPMAVWYFSVDESRKTLKAFLSAHPEVGAGGVIVRLADQADLPPWLKQYGMAEDASIPIHILAEPGGTVRCVRVGRLTDGDFGVIREIVQGR